MGDAHDAPATFRGGIWAGFVPLGTFVLLVLGLVVLGAPTTEGMIVCAMIGISLGMLFATNFARYSERVFTLMANRVASVAIVCWLWAGAFSGVLGASGLVEAIVWMGWKLGFSGSLFVGVTFLSAALFAVFVGTGMGTIIGFTAVMYPAGIVLGAEPAAILGAIISGGAFGDNLAPISDTTIVSAATQETDVPGVVKSRLKYVLVAGAIALVMFLVFGGGEGTSLSPEEGERLIAEAADPRGLPMLIPPVIVFVVAVSGFHFLAALTAGIATACVIGPLFGIFPVSALFAVSEDNLVEGALVSGAMGLVPTAVLTLLLVTAIGILGDSGMLERVMDWLDRRVARTIKGAEASILALISLTNLCVSVNTVAMITAGPLANVLRKRHNIHPYRSANLLDTVSCSWPYMLPYAAITPAAVGTQQLAAQRYDFVEVLGWSEFIGFSFYTMVLFPIMVLAVVTGYGRKRG